MKISGTIFVSLASYCDPLLWWTVRTARETAARPERLMFGVVDQSPARADAQQHREPWRDQVRYLHVAPEDSLGACWARALAFSLYRGEEYLLQVDAHTAFDAGWDDALVEELEAVSRRAGHARAVLSTRPFGFSLDEAGRPATTVYTRQSLALRPAHGARLGDDHPIIAFDAFQSGEERSVPGHQMAAGLIFTRGSFVDEVPYDPRLYFHGEEQNLSIRAFTRGWDIFHPSAPPVYHQYKKHETERHVMHWDPDQDARRSLRWHQLERASRDRMRELLYERSLTGAFGLGDRRSLDDFARFSGIDYVRREIRRP